jgi:type II secretory ATPase GspE/PulE/Tfp pilus assembly ATPase PilB-like protein
MTELGQIDFKTLNLISAEQAHKFRVIPAGQEGQVWQFYYQDGIAPPSQQLQFLLGAAVNFKPVSAAEFERHLARYYPIQVARASSSQPKLQEESDVIRFVRKVMEEAAAMGASDIHVERYESHARIRFRWEGQLIERYEVPADQYNAIVSRIKIMAELDISERRLPQDGRIHMKTGGQNIDVRVSTLPTKFGEKVVMRLLTRSASFLQLENLGMEPEELERFSRALHSPNGIILITGPTGSGKTTTLYAALNILNTPEVNISTIEDPIEYNIEGINQVQVKEEIGFEFGTALRAFLRQDPNIIMIGEIRDRESAEIAIRSAMAGRLVFSTLHTNSSWDAVTRLIDMGVEPYLLASTVRMVMAQRLLRRLCPECKELANGSAVHGKLLSGLGISEHHAAKGCPSCHYTGYIKRKAIYEVVPIDRKLNSKIKQLDFEVDEDLKLAGIRSLKDHVVQLIKDGETSLEEGLSYLLA